MLKVLSGRIARATQHSGWFDIFSSEDAFIYANVVTRVKTGLVTEMSPGLRAKIEEKSGRALAGLVCHGGCIDADYRGEWAVMLSFMMPEPVLFRVCEDKQRENAEKIMRDGYLVLPAGTAIAQFKLEYVPQVELVGEGIVLSDATRGTGGYGSTSPFLESLSALEKAREYLMQAFAAKGKVHLHDANFVRICGPHRFAFHMSNGTRHMGTIEEARISCTDDLTVQNITGL